MVDTIKFSEMPPGGDLANGEKTPGLLSGANVLFNNPWTFLPSGTTAQRPAPSAAINYRLRFNTDDQLYEYYDAVLGMWTQLQESAFTQGPFITYTASVSLPDAQNLGALANGILKQTITLGVATLDIAVNGTDFYGPGFVIPVPDGGSGRASATAFTLIAGGTTSTAAHQSLLAGTAGQLLQSNGASALPTWTTATFPSGSGTLNHMLRSDGTNWVETTATTLTSSDVLSGLTQLNVDNLRLDGNTLSSTDTNGNISLIPNGTGKILINTTIPIGAIGAKFQSVGIATGASSALAAYSIANNGSQYQFYRSSSEDQTVLGAVSNNSVLGSVVMFGDDGVTGFQTSAQIMGLVQGTVSSGIVPAQWIFSTANTSGVLTTAMTISNAQIVELTNALGVPSGGSGRASSTAYALIAGGTTSTGIQQSLATGTSGQFLTSGGASALPAWTTATFPLVAGTTGTILRSNGTNFVNSTSTFADTYAASTLLYSNGANTVTGLATGNNGVLITSAGGVPSISSTLPSAVQTNITALGVIAQNLLLSPNPASNRFIALNDSGSGTGALIVQAGGGSAAFGGSMIMYSQSHATRPGWVTAALASGGSNFFTVNTSGLGAGTDVFTVSAAGNVIANGSLTLSQTAGLIGTTTNNSANAGSVGEAVTNQVLFASQVSLTTTTAVDICSISLTAGDWDVFGTTSFGGGATTTVQLVSGWISTASASQPSDPSNYSIICFGSGSVVTPYNLAYLSMSTPSIRLSLSGTTTVYLSAVSNFGISTSGAFGKILARRRR